MARPKYKLEQPEVTIAILGKAYVIDDQTGEILDWPEGEPRHMDRLVELALLADQSAKRWEDAAVGFKAAIRRMMDKSGVASVKASTGDAALTPWKKDRVPGGDGFLQWLRDVEFPPDSFRALLGAAQEYNVGGFESLCLALDIDADLVEKAITRQGGTYVRLTPARAPAPEISRARSRDEE